MTKRFLPLILLIAIIGMVYSSCKKQSDTQSLYPEVTRGYYPLQLGHWIIFDVDSTIWNDFNCTVTTHHLNMKYNVADTFTDLSGRPSFRIDVYQRVADTGAWQVSTVFYATPTTSGLDIVMNNLRQTKMIFPVAGGLSWIGNRAIDTTQPENQFYGGWVYQYANYLSAYNNGRVNFDNTISVNQVNDSLNNPDTMPTAYAERTFCKEVYGYNVGLVYREFTHWTYDPGTAVNACRKGFSVVMRATDYN